MITGFTISAIGYVFCLAAVLSSKPEPFAAVGLTLIITGIVVTHVLDRRQRRHKK